MAWGYGNVGGGAGGKDVRVLGGLVKPSNPKENDIWLKTDSKIGLVSFTNTQPVSPGTGDVWITVGSGGRGAIEVGSKKQNQTLYPQKAKQWDGFDWVLKQGSSFINGKWVLWDDFIFDNGEIGYPITTYTDRPSNLVNIGASDIIIDVVVSGSNAYIITDGKIDFTDKKAVIIDVVSSDSSGNFVLSITKFDKGQLGYKEVVTNAESYDLFHNPGVHRLDITNVRGEFNLVFGGVSSIPQSMTVRSIRFE